MTAGDIGASQGVVVLAGTALGTVVPAAGLHAAGFRTSLSAAQLERELERRSLSAQLARRVGEHLRAMTPTRV